MKRTPIEISVAALVTVMADLSIILFNPTMNVEKAFNVLVLTFIGAAVITSSILRSRAHGQ